MGNGADRRVDFPGMTGFIPPMARSMSQIQFADFPGHFGELMQGVLGPDGPVVLITLPMRAPVLRLSAGKVTALEEWGQGLGLSTAAHRARFRQVQPDGDLAQEVAYCLAAEGASDPMMFPDPATLLWASRRGEVLDQFPRPPDFDLLCGLWADGQLTDPKDQNFPDISDLVRDWPTTIGKLADLARATSASARRCLALRGPVNDPSEGLSIQLGALGFQIAHTGSARGMIFAPGTVPVDGVACLESSGFRRVRILRFRDGWLEG